MSAQFQGWYEEWYEQRIKELIQHHRTMYGSNPGCAEVATYAFRILSKPQNAAKIPEVAKLIEAAKLDLRNYNNYKKLSEALEPFKGGE